MTTTPVTDDLNAVIVAAVNARVEAAVLQAFSGDEVLGQFVSAALNQPITVKDRDSYRERKTTFIKETIATAVQESVKAAVQRVVEEERQPIEDAVRAELRRSIDTIASQLVGSVSEAVQRPYGMSVALTWPGR